MSPAPENPLYESRDLKEIAAGTASMLGICLDLEPIAEEATAELIERSCYEAKMQGIDECMQILDGTLNANLSSHLTRPENQLLISVLSNIRMMFSWRREIAIKTYDGDGFG